MKKYQQFILEHKFWGKSIPEFLNWLKSKSDRYWVFIDVETTVLREDPYDVQLTQVSCLIVKYNPNSNCFEEVDT